VTKIGFGTIEKTKKEERKFDRASDKLGDSVMLEQVLERVTNKDNFKTLQNYIDFASYFLDYIEKNKQATIVSQNENIYNFFQYKKEANFQVTRPFNSTILYSSEEFADKSNELLSVLQYLKNDRDQAEILDRNIINRGIYTIQQAIGFALDGLPAKQTNTARKLNGDFFEQLILLLLQEIGIDANNGVVQVPVKMDGQELFSMSYQHDLIVKNSEGNINLIGSVKTTSKDRIDKIFIDKFLYSKLTETKVPHIAIFLHDVQRKKTKDPRKFGVNGTFLTGHFKGYTVKLNPLDGVYYFDPRPIMQTDTLLSQHIQTFDHLLCDDIWNYID
jgi:hypothetical protein